MRQSLRLGGCRPGREVADRGHRAIGPDGREGGAADDPAVGGAVRVDGDLGQAGALGPGADRGQDRAAGFGLPHPGVGDAAHRVGGDHPVVRDLGVALGGGDVALAEEVAEQGRRVARAGADLQHGVPVLGAQGVDHADGGGRGGGGGGGEAPDGRGDLVGGQMPVELGDQRPIAVREFDPLRRIGAALGHRPPAAPAGGHEHPGPQERLPGHGLHGGAQCRAGQGAVRLKPVGECSARGCGVRGHGSPSWGGCVRLCWIALLSAELTSTVTTQSTRRKKRFAMLGSLWRSGREASAPAPAPVAMENAAAATRAGWGRVGSATSSAGAAGRCPRVGPSTRRRHGEGGGGGGRRRGP